jgi:hypothetical protein
MGMPSANAVKVRKAVSKNAVADILVFIDRGDLIVYIDNPAPMEPYRIV